MMSGWGYVLVRLPTAFAGTWALFYHEDAGALLTSISRLEPVPVTYYVTAVYVGIAYVLHAFHILEPACREAPDFMRRIARYVTWVTGCMVTFPGIDWAY
jgi:hypothetical protein